ncbi:hypothetical protein Emed_006894 [Eimeria media]
MEKYRRVRPAREPLENDEIRVTAMGRVMNYVSYAGTLITDQKLRQLTIKASGNAIGQAIALAEQLKRRYKGLHQLNTCGNTTVSLVYEPIEEGLDQVTEERVVAFLEIKLSFDPLDQNDPGYQAPFDEATFNELKPVAAPGPSGQLRGRGGYRGGMRGRGRNFGGEGTEGEGGDSGGAEDFDDDQPHQEGSGYREEEAVSAVVTGEDTEGAPVVCEEGGEVALSEATEMMRNKSSKKKRVVPSDITLLEAQQQTAPRRLRFLERCGLMGIPPMYHSNYSKLDRVGMRAVLSRSYDPDTPDAATDICRRRQESIRKRVVAQNGVWVGAIGATALVHYSLRHYDYKTKLIALPFIAYGGSWLGRWIAGGMSMLQILSMQQQQQEEKEADAKAAFPEVSVHPVAAAASASSEGQAKGAAGRHVREPSGVYIKQQAAAAVEACMHEKQQEQQQQHQQQQQHAYISSSSSMHASAAAEAAAEAAAAALYLAEANERFQLSCGDSKSLLLLLPQREEISLDHGSSLGRQHGVYVLPRIRNVFLQERQRQQIPRL